MCRELRWLFHKTFANSIFGFDLADFPLLILLSDIFSQIFLSSNVSSKVNP